MSSDEQYYINLFHHQDNGGDWAEFGYIYHGVDANENSDFAGFSANELQSIGETHEVKEETRLDIANTGSVETQKFNFTSDQPFQILICPSDSSADEDCARTGNLELGNSGSSAEDALNAALESQCSTMGTINTENGVYFNMEHSHSFGSKTFYGETSGSFCGSRRALVSPKGTKNVLFNQWTSSSINPYKGQGFSSKYNKDVCFGIKGFAKTAHFVDVTD